MSRKHYDSNTKWEPLVGYSRAVRIGDTIRVSGTTATDETGDVVGPGDPYAQTVQAINNIATALRELGGELEHVVRTRIYVVNIQNWPDVGRAHAEAFGEIRPASTMVEVRRLADPEMLIEIEADAVII
jgi:enamine deaminase RidA (YjgF/YER057c/UK114 family)